MIFTVATLFPQSTQASCEIRIPLSAAEWRKVEASREWSALIARVDRIQTGARACCQSCSSSTSDSSGSSGLGGKFTTDNPELDKLVRVLREVMRRGVSSPVRKNASTPVDRNQHKGQGGNRVTVHVDVDSSAIDQLADTAQKLVDLLSEAKVLSDDIVKTMSAGITVSTKCLVPN